MRVRYDGLEWRQSFRLTKLDHLPSRIPDVEVKKETRDGHSRSSALRDAGRSARWPDPMRWSGAYVSSWSAAARALVWPA
jgi:hypothetical protein